MSLGVFLFILASPKLDSILISVVFDYFYISLPFHTQLIGVLGLSFPHSCVTVHFSNPKICVFDINIGNFLLFLHIPLFFTPCQREAELVFIQHWQLQYPL
jgi:hypothetical protein